MLEEHIKYVGPLIAELTSRPTRPLDLVLRGHLMVEQLLDRCLRPWFQNEESFEDARLRFPQKIQLTRGLNIRHAKEPIWSALQALNALRNDFAHNLTSTAREAKVRSFLDATDDDLPITKEEKARAKGLQEHERLALAFTYLLGCLYQIALEYEERSELAHMGGMALLAERYNWRPDGRPEK